MVSDVRYEITHITTYTYDRPVTLAPHTIRLRPRSDVAQSLQDFSLDITPTPTRLSETVDLDGNAILKAWFADEALTHFEIKTVSQVETHRSNPFDFILEPWATKLPIRYPNLLFTSLQPYLIGHLLNLPGALDPIAAQLAQEIWQEVSGDTISFLSTLNQKIYATCGYQMRDEGAPHPPGITWTQKAGSCRDLAVLFMETCRTVGLAARFVSGYQEGDLDSDDRHLHAWAEVYLPGAGWRGYDPTQGLAVSDRHVAIMSCPHPQESAPVSGAISKGGNVQSHMQYQLLIRPGEPF